LFCSVQRNQIACLLADNCIPQLFSALPILLFIVRTNVVLSFPAKVSRLMFSQLVLFHMSHCMTIISDAACLYEERCLQICIVVFKPAATPRAATKEREIASIKDLRGTVSFDQIQFSFNNFTIEQLSLRVDKVNCSV
jgi:hypothetical protein